MPKIVIITTIILTLFGIYIIIKQVMGRLKLRDLVCFSILSLGVISFNIAYIALTVPLKLSSAEGLLVGSILDIILNIIFLYYSGKNLRSQYITVDADI